MKFSIVITALALISSTVTAIALPNEQDLVARDNEEVEARTNIACFVHCKFIAHKSTDECRKLCG